MLTLNAHNRRVRLQLAVGDCCQVRFLSGTGVRTPWIPLASQKKKPLNSTVRPRRAASSSHKITVFSVFKSGATQLPFSFMIENLRKQQPPERKSQIRRFPCKSRRPPEETLTAVELKRRMKDSETTVFPAPLASLGPMLALPGSPV